MFSLFNNGVGELNNFRFFLNWVVIDFVYYNIVSILGFR